jgi:hypothetical protein
LSEESTIHVRRNRRRGKWKHLRLSVDPDCHGGATT